METTAEPAAADHELVPVVRFIYRGESLRNGRVCRLAVEDLNAERPTVVGKLLLQAMRREDANLDLARFAPFVYSQELEGWVALRPETEVPLRAEPSASTAATRLLRAEVMLEVKQPAAPARERDLSVTAALSSAASVAVATVGGAAGTADAGQATAPADRTADRAVSAEGATEGTAEGAAGGAAEGAAASDAGFFAVGVYNSKSAENVGTLWRSAFQLGAAYIFTIGTIQ